MFFRKQNENNYFLCIFPRLLLTGGLVGRELELPPWSLVALVLLAALSRLLDWLVDIIPLPLVPDPPLWSLLWNDCALLPMYLLVVKFVGDKFDEGKVDLSRWSRWSRSRPRRFRAWLLERPRDWRASNIKEIISNLLKKKLIKIFQMRLLWLPCLRDFSCFICTALKWVKRSWNFIPSSFIDVVLVVDRLKSTVCVLIE